MKWMIVIWAIFVLALNLVPCSDAYNSCNVDLPAEHTAHHDDKAAAHEHSADHDDTCSPFCTCACCGISFTDLSFKVNSAIANDNLEYFERKFVVCDIAFRSSFFGNIWQPPRVSA